MVVAELARVWGTAARLVSGRRDSRPNQASRRCRRSAERPTTMLLRSASAFCPKALTPKYLRLAIGVQKVPKTRFRASPTSHLRAPVRNSSALQPDGGEPKANSPPQTWGAVGDRAARIRSSASQRGHSRSAKRFPTATYNKPRPQPLRLTRDPFLPKSSP